MIDKRIFYCWFGNGEMSDLNKRCIESWKRCCPDYEIVKINEENFDYNKFPYAKAGYEHGNWSYVTDVVRLEILKHQSGIYLDTDVELVKSLDWLRQFDKGFITEFESGQPDSGVLGCGTYPKLYQDAYDGLNVGTVLHLQFIQRLYERYEFHGEPVAIYEDGFAILGEEFFPTARTGLFTKNTIGIHYFENTWMNGWTGIDSDFHPYPRVIVCLGNTIVFEEKNPTVKINLKNRNKGWSHPEIHEKVNYFFNPNVVMLRCRDFDAERLVYDRNRELTTTVTASGLLVTRMKGEGNG